MTCRKNITDSKFKSNILFILTFNSIYSQTKYFYVFTALPYRVINVLISIGHLTFLGRSYFLNSRCTRVYQGTQGNLVLIHLNSLMYVSLNHVIRRVFLIAWHRLKMKKKIVTSCMFFKIYAYWCFFKSLYKKIGLIILKISSSFVLFRLILNRCYSKYYLLRYHVAILPPIKWNSYNITYYKYV